MQKSNDESLETLKAEIALRKKQRNKDAFVYPAYQDEVKSLICDVYGTVIARYSIDNEVFLDVRDSSDKIYYGTLAKNWKTVRTEEDRI